MWAVVYYFCRENGERRVVSVTEYDSLTEAQVDMVGSAESAKQNLRDKEILRAHETGKRFDIDARGLQKEWYSWEIVKVTI